MGRRFVKRTTLVAVVGVAVLAAGAAQAVGVPGQGTWETTLQPRDLDGNGEVDAFYDATLNITWARNATMDGSRGLSWDDARAWASSLTIGGANGWRLPTMIDTAAPGCQFGNSGGTDCGFNVQPRSGGITFNEMAHLYYVTLGNLGYCAVGDEVCSTAQPGWGLANTGNFQNLDDVHYVYTDLLYPDPRGVFDFSFIYGHQSFGSRFAIQMDAMVVHAGDVAPIPEPQSVAMLVAGLGVLAVAVRRRVR
jgi:hypothetical protein